MCEFHDLLVFKELIKAAFSFAEAADLFIRIFLIVKIDFRYPYSFHEVIFALELIQLDLIITILFYFSFFQFRF